MAVTIAQLQAAIADIKNTSSEKVEYNDGSSSLRVVISYLEQIAHQGTIFQVADIDAMKALSYTDATFVQIQDAASGASAGIYSYRSTGTADNINSFDASGGGIWKKASLSD